MNQRFPLALLPLALALVAGCGPKPGGSPYVISEEKAPVKVKLAKGGQAYSPGGSEAPSLALYGTGGFRVDLKPKGGGVFESSPDNPVPHGEYSVTVVEKKGRAIATQTVARNVKVGTGPNDFTFEMK
jgi:hypothetical protein